MNLTAAQLDTYQKDGYITFENIFTQDEMEKAINEAHQWQEEFLKDISEEDIKWYHDGATAIPNQVRKLDNPVSQRAFFKKLALNPELIVTVEDLIGRDVIAFFSQVFFKPPHGGGPKPTHQDNFYFGPDKSDHVITIWIAFEDATVENGCLYYGKGSHQGKLIKHFAPEDEPFNYQIPDSKKVPMTPAPVKKGGINMHHGKTLHQSSNNTSDLWRRALAIHFMQKDVKLIDPVFKFDPIHFVEAF